jgi:hypothetical protein
MREFTVTIKVIREHFATIKVRAASQAEADKEALALYWKERAPCRGLGLRPPWKQHEPREAAETDTTFRCVDCGKYTVGGYMVSGALWPASGLAPNGGMLCLACLERRPKRQLTFGDFAAQAPSRES